MVVMISQGKSMEQLLDQLRASHPHISFVAGNTFVWSPETQEVFYKENARDDKAIWSLLHETGHALLNHTGYKADMELVLLEMAAWDKAKVLASEVGVTISEDHVQDCLDTYRDWLHKRSICPSCTTKCLQQSDMRHYRCHNCHTTWKVTASRFARAYRSTKGVQMPTALFHVTDN